MTKEDTSEKPVTMKQVADRAGVSTATVSRVLSGQVTVSKNLSERVLRAVAELNYRPDRSARNFRTRVAKIIGVVISDIQNPFFTSVVRGIEHVIESQDYALMLFNSDEDLDRERRQIQILQEEKVAGIILTPTSSHFDAYRSFAEGNVPLVFIDRSIDGADVDMVTVKNTAGASSAVSHLIALGHSRISLIGGPEQVSTAKQRKEGYLAALAKAGITPSLELIQYENLRQDGGYRAMQSLLDLTRPPTAVFVVNNLMTLGALQAIHERGIEIPHEIAVVGFDDMPWALSLQPPLTVVAQPTYELGIAAAQLLLERIKEPDRLARHIILETRLLVRASSSGVENRSPV